MLFTLMNWLINTLQVLFFVGLAGCAVVVTISWIQVSRSAFSKD
ncbi:MAG TPA: hypothetical protein VFI20_10140 [Terracidiphilus sp.]|nr:hypothetical protein [Terracidiphilus sp.]